MANTSHLSLISIKSLTSLIGEFDKTNDNITATTFSRILEMKMRFEIGRKLLRSSVDRDGFLRRGWTRACLNDDGKFPSERERLTRFVMIGPSSLKQSFKRKVGMESRGHCLLSGAEMSLLISARVAGIKLIIIGGGAGRNRNGSGDEMVKIWCECD